jgi:hypothetical protein
MALENMMQVKVHWIIDGVAEMDVKTIEDAEKNVETILGKLVSDNPQLTETLGARAIQGKAYLPGSEEDEDVENS